MKRYEFVIVRIEQGMYDDIRDAVLNAKHYCDDGEKVISIVELSEVEASEVVH